MTPTSTRFYGLDALRASMMLLGIVLHLSLPYAGLGVSGYFVTSERNAILGLLILALHYFRMPVFYLLSGFFSALLIEKGGVRRFLERRGKRVAIVWLAALAIELPLVGFISVYNHFASSHRDALGFTWNAITTRQVNASWQHEPALHLWFLEYLLLFCLVTAVTVKAGSRFLPALDRWAERIIGSRLRVFFLAIPTTASLCFMPFAAVPYPTSFIPWLGVSLDYGWFFVCGFLMYRSRQRLPSLVGRMRFEKIAAPILYLVILMLLQRHSNNKPPTGFAFDLLLAFITSLFIWSMIVILVGNFQKVKRRPWLPYIADASYWIYLAHYPLALLAPSLWRFWAISPLVKVAVSAISIFSILLVMYHKLIRYSVIGVALNGPRFRQSISESRIL